ncbi:hypothetical protein EK21DRAFT_116287 [Setomelanomma holmii]|uniref:Phosphotransferase n=1 Tax=Setomelanomma holmii TaxID=210430 RepID=A0A9P4H3H2_9PLEO|nr:hypothetical protein EK21DRAFT_116287 [Setomelanomma holmii]
MTVQRYFTWIQRLLCRPSVSRNDKLEDVKEVEEYAPKILEQSSSDTDVEEKESLQDLAERIVREFEFSDEDVRRGVIGFLKQMNEGLRKHGCMIEQLPSYIRELPTGREKGTYLAVDLGGTNIRVCSVILQGDGSYDMIQEKAAIPVHLMASKAPTELFHSVATKIEQFLKSHHSGSINLSHQQESFEFNLGFTFSHAVQQSRINSGTLIRWSKGFSIDGAVGQDVCALLQSALIDVTTWLKSHVILL